jgi:hypothetical protein
MSQGFARMDVSTSIHGDPKFRLLSRRHPEQTAASLAACLILLAESWREGRRLSLDEAWTLMPYDEAVPAAMADVGLIDDEGRIPEHVWAAWFGAAERRRELGREKQRRADAKRGRTRLDSSRPALSRPVPDRSTDGPTDGPTMDEEAEEDWDPKWVRFLEEWHARFALPPTPEQRLALWKVIDARPNDAATWLADARSGCTSFEAIALVFKRWADLRSEVA